MEILLALFQSEFVQTLLVLVGLGGALKLVDMALPSDSPARRRVRWIARVYLAVVAIIVVTMFVLEVVDLAVFAAVLIALLIREAGDRLLKWLPIDYQRRNDQPVVETPAAPERALVAPSRGECYTYYASRYGMGYEKLNADCIIRKDGSAEVRREVEVRAYSQFDTLDTFLLIPEPSPDGETRAIDLLEVRSRSLDYNVSVKEPFGEEGRLYAVMKISPQLIAGETVEYEMVERLPHRLYAIDLSGEELLRRKTPFDYFGWNINRPLRRLLLRVYFPDQVVPDVYGVEVRYAPAAPGLFQRAVQHAEQARLAKPSLEGPEGGRYSLKLDVEYPMIGLIYLLRWEPLETRSGPAASVDAVPVDKDSD